MGEQLQSSDQPSLRERLRLKRVKKKPTGFIFLQRINKRRIYVEHIINDEEHSKGGTAYTCKQPADAEPIDISRWTSNDKTGRLPLSCNCMGKYCDSNQNAVPGVTSVGLMILLVRIEQEMNRRFNRNDIVIHLTDDMNLQDIDDRNGGNRCEKWNRLHGGAEGSQHTKWRAADIYFDCLVDDNCPDMEDLYAVADELNPYGGVGEYDYNVHVDTRGSWSRW